MNTHISRIAMNYNYCRKDGFQLFQIIYFITSLKGLWKGEASLGKMSACFYRSCASKYNAIKVQ